MPVLLYVQFLISSYSCHLPPTLKPYRFYILSFIRHTAHCIIAYLVVRLDCNYGIKYYNDAKTVGAESGAAGRGRRRVQKL